MGMGMYIIGRPSPSVPLICTYVLMAIVPGIGVRVAGGVGDISGGVGDKKREVEMAAGMMVMTTFGDEEVCFGKFGLIHKR